MEDDSRRAAGELRQNVLTGHWVAVAPGRARRPGGRIGRTEAAGAEHAADCPFCPGNESELPDILVEVPAPDDSPWRARVVPNRYPAFTNDARRGEALDHTLADAESGLGTGLPLGSDVPVRVSKAVPATGYQEVIIEGSRHDRDLDRMDDGELAEVVDLYHARYVAVSDSAPAARVFVFRNRGREAGTSLEHPHAQLVATSAVPPDVRVREIRMAGYHGDHGRCLVCSLDELEPDSERRLVAENEHFRAIVPWAAETPCEVWIVPTRHQADFGEATQEQRHALARILGTVLRGLRDHADDPAYNLMIHSPRRSRSGSAAYHWFVQLRPRYTFQAGFELATGVTINPSSPEADARALRGEAAEGGAQAP